MKTRVLLCLVLIFLIKFCDSSPVDLEYEPSSKESFRGGIRFRIENNSGSEEMTDVMKRQTSAIDNSSNATVNNSSAEQTVSLSDIIRRIEIGFLRSASNLVQAFKNSNSEDSDDDDGDNVRRPLLFSFRQIQKRAVPENIAEGTPMSPVAEDGASSHEKPEVISVDRYLIYPRVGCFPIVPAFHRHGERKAREAFEHEIKKSDVNESKITGVKKHANRTSSSSVTTSTEKLHNQPSTTKTESSTVSQEKSSLHQIQNNTKDRIDKLKEVEDDIKKKVAEIEANPIILSSRV